MGPARIPTPGLLSPGVMTPIASASQSANHMLPSTPLVIPPGPLLLYGTAISVMTPVVGSIVPIWPAPCMVSVNQSLPSGPRVIPLGYEPAVGVLNSVMVLVLGLILPITFDVFPFTTGTVNQTSPSGPAVMKDGKDLA